MSLENNVSQFQVSQYQQALASADEAVNSVLTGECHELDLVALRVFFAEARDALAAAFIPLENAHTIQDELSLLKKELTGRILSMTRATSIAQDKHLPEFEAAIPVDDTQMSASDLLQLYRKSCARFRDTFPGNTRYLGSGSPALRDWSEFKSNQ